MKDEYPFDPNLEEEESELSEEADQAEPPPTDIVAYNELRSCADLKRMQEKGQLKTDPDFQREFVWKKADQTRFIDSLTKQLPIPSMCISYDFITDERLVIDGRQRISTILEFLSNEEYKLSKLDDIDGRIAGKTVYEIKTKNKTLFERVENLIIPVTVIRCDTQKHSHMDYLFTIFHRLNSGGSKLNNQEIRNCIYNGKFNTFLKATVKYPNYRKLMGVDDTKGFRFAYEEQNLRFFAFFDKLNSYHGKFAKFLNDYMFAKEKGKPEERVTEDELALKDELFKKTVDLTYEKILGKKDLKGVSKAIIDAVLVGVAKNLDYVNDLEKKSALKLYSALRHDELFSIESLREGLAKKGRVETRLKRAIEIFAGN
jgi:hypothetical protein